jgi:glutaredoxin
MEQKVINKIINAPKDTYIIFFKRSCPYCKGAFDKLRNNNLSYKGYDVENIPGVSFPQLLNFFINNTSQIGFNPTHVTVPIIFFNGRFIGGSDSIRVNS